MKRLKAQLVPNIVHLMFIVGRWLILNYAQVASPHSNII